jgi:hypothetical protein
LAQLIFAVLENRNVGHSDRKVPPTRLIELHLTESGSGI